MSNLKATVTADLKAIPRERLGQKIRRTVTGLAFVAAAGVVLKFLPGAPWWVPLVLFGLGMHIISGDLVRVASKAILAGAKDAVGLVRGRAE